MLPLWNSSSHFNFSLYFHRFEAAVVPIFIHCMAVYCVSISKSILTSLSLSLQYIFYFTKLILCCKRSRGYLCWRHRQQWGFKKWRGITAALTAHRTNQFQHQRDGISRTLFHSIYLFRWLLPIVYYTLAASSTSVCARERESLFKNRILYSIFRRLKWTQLYFHYDLNEECWHAHIPYHHSSSEKCINSWTCCNVIWLQLFNEFNSTTSSLSLSLPPVVYVCGYQCVRSYECVW